MQGVDYFVLIFYLVGMLLIGVTVMGRIKTPADMFGAGEKSPWWASGLSSFMTMFSAGTFVVWGGVAYRLGLVAIAINLCYGIAALIAGWTVAGRWKQLGIRTPAEFVQLRFGDAALHFFTWTMIVYRMLGSAVALYALAVMLSALMPLPEGVILRDPATGNLSLVWAIILFGGVTVLYTMLGGLWAVLLTDVLQFLVLNLSVLIIVPLLLLRFEGGFKQLDSAPEGFFYLTSGQYSWLFLAGWTTIHFFIIGAEWAFVQRFLCVPTDRDARKSMWLFGILYLISPWVWMLPPFLYRFMDPDVPHEEAYVRSCVSVLPVGMIGLMLAAMFSATASMISSQLNVFSGVLTEDFYRPLRPSASESDYLFAGRCFSGLLGLVLILLAMAVPQFGGAEKTVVAITNLIVTPLLAPTLLGLLSSRISSAAMWSTAVICFTCGLVSKFASPSWLTAIQEQLGGVDTVIGVILPLVILTGWLLCSRTTDPGWDRLHSVLKHRRETESPAIQQDARFDSVPAYLVAISIGVSGLLTGGLIWVNRSGPFSEICVLAIFSAGLCLIAICIAAMTARKTAQSYFLNQPDKAGSE